jgi:hypothetical protein
VIEHPYVSLAIFLVVWPVLVLVGSRLMGNRRRPLPMVPPGYPSRFCPRRAQLRHVRDTVTHWRRGELPLRRALYLEYRRDRYVRHLLRAASGG